jgi:predicted DNA-binding WGR domain protein
VQADVLLVQAAEQEEEGRAPRALAKNPPAPRGYVVFRGKTPRGNRSHKFWYGSVRGKVLYRAWGSVDGKRFRHELVTYASRPDALADLAKILASKKRKGYRGAALPGFLKQAEKEFR